MSFFPSTRKFGLWRLPGRGLWGSSRAGRQLAALCFNLVVFSLSSSHLSVVPSKAQLLFRIYSFPFIQAFQGEFFHVTVLFSLTILFLQKHVPCFKFSLFFFFLNETSCLFFSPVFSPCLVRLLLLLVLHCWLPEKCFSFTFIVIYWFFPPYGLRTFCFYQMRH